MITSIAYKKLYLNVNITIMSLDEKLVRTNLDWCMDTMYGGKMHRPNLVHRCNIRGNAFSIMR